MLFGILWFLRAGEFTVSADNSFNPNVHCLNDIAADNPAQPQVIQRTITQSKTDPFQKVPSWKTFSDSCSVASLLNYLLVRDNKLGLLFIFTDGWLLTRQRLVQALRGALHTVGIDQSRYCAHRIGDNCRIEDSRWNKTKINETQRGTLVSPRTHSQACIHTHTHTHTHALSL